MSLSPTLIYHWHRQKTYRWHYWHWWCHHHKCRCDYQWQWHCRQICCRCQQRRWSICCWHQQQEWICREFLAKIKMTIKELFGAWEKMIKKVKISWQCPFNEGFEHVLFNRQSSSSASLIPIVKVYLKTARGNALRANYSIKKVKVFYWPFCTEEER